MDFVKEFLDDISNQKRKYNKIKVELDLCIELVNKIGIAYCDKFMLNKHFMDFYTQLIYYFTQNEKFNGDLKKGIYILGNIGRGKTLAMLIMKKFCNVLNRSMNFKYIDTEEFNIGFSTDGNKIFADYQIGNLCINDIGGEKNPEVNYFGSLQNPIAILLKLRYTLFQEKGILTHATGNWGYKKLESIYGAREISRCKEMFNIVSLDGKDMRI